MKTGVTKFVTPVFIYVVRRSLIAVSGQAYIVQQGGQ